MNKYQGQRKKKKKKAREIQDNVNIIPWSRTRLQFKVCEGQPSIFGCCCFRLPWITNPRINIYAGYEWLVDKCEPNITYNNYNMCNMWRPQTVYSFTAQPNILNTYIFSWVFSLSWKERNPKWKRKRWLLVVYVFGAGLCPVPMRRSPGKWYLHMLGHNGWDGCGERKELRQIMQCGLNARLRMMCVFFSLVRYIAHHIIFYRHCIMLWRTHAGGHRGYVGLMEWVTSIINMLKGRGGPLSDRDLVQILFSMVF